MSPDTVFPRTILCPDILDTVSTPRDLWKTTPMTFTYKCPDTIYRLPATSGTSSLTLNSTRYLLKNPECLDTTHRVPPFKYPDTMYRVPATSDTSSPALNSSKITSEESRMPRHDISRSREMRISVNVWTSGGPNQENALTPDCPDAIYRVPASYAANS
ncbi:hypothetical protein JR316_0009955 [Psilocybe cubensis]|uniref:Uncharacterized protein n=2 Tax=Psilocybe cubensis TaxID=181762 RepID=A0A8H7XPP7_PSICU|nr:hypothetical protein JR316_0009955 [Psilocybe cubensis]KAH9477728.1 hypothetical protein JR316_0009955 [Psilocybe cubensis]